MCGNFMSQNVKALKLTDEVIDASLVIKEII